MGQESQLVIQRRKCRFSIIHHLVRSRVSTIFQFFHHVCEQRDAGDAGDVGVLILLMMLMMLVLLVMLTKLVQLVKLSRLHLRSNS